MHRGRRCPGLLTAARRRIGRGVRRGRSAGAGAAADPAVRAGNLVEWQGRPGHPRQGGKALCSVPWRLIGQRVDARETWTTVRIFHNGTLVATHARAECKRTRCGPRPGVVRRRRPATTCPHRSRAALDHTWAAASRPCPCQPCLIVLHPRRHPVPNGCSSATRSGTRTRWILTVSNARSAA